MAILRGVNFSFKSSLYNLLYHNSVVDYNILW
ncbi:Uncharacterised protein [Yersinia kristensenii]|uniref:Uncharacterized protein n=1 Tax=Yersinia kristensenii TaxID=28152 RepID=A0A0T9M4F2_YERKR|nr:Uncharacterised protein [Yersinia kristensenii]